MLKFNNKYIFKITQNGDNYMHIKAKLWIIVLLSLFGGLITIFGSAYFSFLNLREQNRVELEHRVHAVHKLLQYHYELSKKGEIEEPTAKKMAIAAIKVLGMSDPTQYIWMHDLREPVPRMIMHPLYPELDTKVLDNPQFYCADKMQLGEDDGKLIPLSGKENLFAAMNNVVNKAGSGYVFYQWTKPLPNGKYTQEVYKKGSFVQKFEPWGWVVGSGIYQDEMLQAAFMNFIKASMILFIYIVLILLVAIWIFRSITKPITQLLASVHTFKTNLAHRAIVTKEDEIGILAKEFNIMANAIGSQIRALRDQALTLGEQAASIEAHSEHLEELVEERTKELLEANKEIMTQIEIIDQYVITSTTDINGKITYASKAFCDLLGYSKEELFGQTHRIVKNPNATKDLYEQMWGTITNGKSWISEIQNKTKDGTLHWLKVRISPIIDENSVITGYSAIRENINDKIEAQQLAITDQLTKLYNRRELDKNLELHTALCKRYKTPFSVIMIDIDKFKEVNDLYGHQVGDSVLQKMAELLKMRVRETDIVGRWGGEEFLILLPNTTLEQGLIIAESLRKCVAAYKFETVGNKTISLGVSEYKDSVQEIIKRADDALYKAKEDGRNRVDFL